MEQVGSDREVFYYNEVTGESTWEHPLDQAYRSVLQRLRQPTHGTKMAGSGRSSGAGEALTLHTPTESVLSNSRTPRTALSSSSSDAQRPPRATSRSTPPPAHQAAPPHQGLSRTATPSAPPRGGAGAGGIDGGAAHRRGDVAPAGGSLVEETDIDRILRLGKHRDHGKEQPASSSPPAASAADARPGGGASPRDEAPEGAAGKGPAAEESLHSIAQRFEAMQQREERKRLLRRIRVEVPPLLPPPPSNTQI